MTKPGCSIHGLIAREAPVGVLFRRGPSKQVQLILWDIEKDRFEPGQWLRGRLYERAADLSPDGRLLVCFAASWKARRGPDGGSWTAISRPPFLTALACWTKGDAWGGGGLFADDGHLVLDSIGAPHVRTAATPARLPVRVTELGEGARVPIESMREKAYGWVVRQEHRVVRGAPHPRVLEKARKRCVLRREQRTPGDPGTWSVAGSSIDLAGADWADWDSRGRIAFARNGCVFAAAPDDPGAALKPLIDLRANRFAALKPPAWATQWPRP